MIYGIDPAGRGVAVFAIDSTHAAAYVLEVERTNRGQEIRELHDKLGKLLQRDPEPIVFVEAPVVAGARNLQTTIQLAQTVGMVMALPHRTYQVAIGSWKAATVGRGDASKESVSDWLREAYPEYHSLCDGNGDLVDAAAICVYGRQLTEKKLDLSGSGHT